MFMVVLFITAKGEKKSKCPSINKLIKQNVINTYNGILFAIQRNKALINATKWMSL